MFLLSTVCMIFLVLIIPKWLIYAPNDILIVFGIFLELPTNQPNLSLCTPYLSHKHSKTYKQNPQHICKTYYFDTSQHLGDQTLFNNLYTSGHQQIEHGYYHVVCSFNCSGPKKLLTGYS